MEIALPWLANPRNPAMRPHCRHPSTLIESVRGQKEGRVGLGNAARNVLKFPAPKKDHLRRHQLVEMKKEVALYLLKETTA